MNPRESIARTQSAEGGLGTGCRQAREMSRRVALVLPDAPGAGRLSRTSLIALSMAARSGASVRCRARSAGPEGASGSRAPSATPRARRLSGSLRYLAKSRRAVPAGDRPAGGCRRQLGDKRYFAARTRTGFRFPETRRDRTHHPAGFRPDILAGPTSNCLSGPPVRPAADSIAGRETSLPNLSRTSSASRPS